MRDTLIPSNRKASHILSTVGIGIFSINRVRNQLNENKLISISRASRCAVTRGHFSVSISLSTLCNTTTVTSHVSHHIITRSQKVFINTMFAIFAAQFIFIFLYKCYSRGKPK